MRAANAKHRKRKNREKERLKKEKNVRTPEENRKVALFSRLDEFAIHISTYVPSNFFFT